MPGEFWEESVNFQSGSRAVLDSKSVEAAVRCDFRPQGHAPESSTAKQFVEDLNCIPRKGFYMSLLYSKASTEKAQYHEL